MSHVKIIALDELRGQVNSAVHLANWETWYQLTEEYNIWKMAEACEFLWFRGRSDDGKTLEIRSIIRTFDETENEIVGTIAYLCPRTSLTTETVLHSIITQLARKGTRVAVLDPRQKMDLLTFIRSKNIITTEVLWGLF